MNKWIYVHSFVICKTDGILLGKKHHKIPTKETPQRYAIPRTTRKNDNVQAVSSKSERVPTFNPL